ncbi:1313_t:CDS:2 [Acaulospora colombiana]|uniref:1313_t:CDS:1 n=1 Tax=Acaulospora colombiana TaxID=27376 RepID=A0ACA9KM54_9GLOM|nr:1313_t:CDS:2 [Acaulospora colombiana]
MSYPFPDTYDSNHMKTTDKRRWRLFGDHGRQAWHYIEDEEQLKEWPQTNCEKYWLGLPFESKEHEKSQEHHIKDEGIALTKTALEAAHKGFKFYKELQTKDGHWAGTYGGPMYLVSALMIAVYVTHMTFPESWRIEIMRYLVNKVNPVDGGWGMQVSTSLSEHQLSF